MEGILVKPGENTLAGRWIKFTDVAEIAAMESTLKAYIYEAIEVEKACVKLEPVKSSDLIYPDEFRNKSDQNPALKKAFEALTPGRQRAYYIYFSAPKQSKTRAARVEKCVPQILNGKELTD